MLEILIIEDDIIDQLALIRLIKKNGLNCKVTACTKIDHAKEKIKSKKFDLVICDLNLPDGKAFDLKDLIKKQPFILLSGHVDNEIIEEGEKYGILNILQKSSNLSQLNAISALIKSMIVQTVEPVVPKEAGNIKTKNFNLDHLIKTFDNNLDEVYEITSLFIENCPLLLSNIRLSIDEDDRKKTHLLLHRLKSNCMMIGIKKEEILAGYLEHKVFQLNKIHLKEQVSMLSNNLTQILPELQYMINELKKKL